MMAPLYTYVYGPPHIHLQQNFVISKKHEIIQLVQQELELQAQENSQMVNRRF